MMLSPPLPGPVDRRPSMRTPYFTFSDSQRDRHCPDFCEFEACRPMTVRHLLNVAGVLPRRKAGDYSIHTLPFASWIVAVAFGSDHAETISGSRSIADTSRLHCAPLAL